MQSTNQATKSQATPLAPNLTQQLTNDVPEHVVPASRKDMGAVLPSHPWYTHCTPTLLISSVTLAMILLFTLAAPWLSGVDPNAQSLRHRLLLPSTQHLLGTDHLGRDVLARLLHGGRYSLLLTCIAVLISGGLGTVLGAIAGWLGGLWDELLMRLVDLLIVFPSIVLALVIAALLDPSFGALLLALTITSWTPYVRLARALTLDIKTKPYLEAAKSLGVSLGGILSRYILPNIAGPILAISFLRFGHMLLTIAGLSYLGLGAQPPTPDWGTMIADSLPYMQRIPSLLLLPSLAIFCTALSVTLMGQGLMLIFDPKQRRL